MSKTAPQTLRSCSRARRNSVQKRSVHEVREYFEPDFNAAIGQEMSVCRAVFLHERDGIYVDDHPHPAMLKDSGIFSQKLTDKLMQSPGMAAF